MQASTLFLLMLSMFCATFATAAAQLPSTGSGWIVQANVTPTPTFTTSTPTASLLRRDTEKLQALQFQQTTPDAVAPQAAHVASSPSSGVAVGAVGALAVAVVVVAVVYKAKQHRGPLLPMGALPSPTTPTA